jgi:hypothetical protein
MIEAMKQALEKIANVNAMDYEYQRWAREALAIAELESQEPVAWISPKGHIHFDPYLDSVPLYAHPPQRTEQEPVCPECKAEVLYECVACSRNNYPPQRTWVGLTDEEIQDAGRFSYCRGGTSEKLYHIMWNSQPSACIGWSREELIAFTKAVEAKYQEKNQ